LKSPFDDDLFDRISERFGILAHTSVSGDDRYQRRWLAEQFRGREVYGVERADWFEWKGASDSVEHCSINVENEAAPLERAESADGGVLLFCRQTTSRARSNDGPSRFRECEGRGHLLGTEGHRPYDGRVVLQ